MTATSPPIQLWLKSEPFTIGALPTPPHPRLTVNNIRKIVTYAKSRPKGKSGFPNLSYAVWKHISVNKLQLPEDVAWCYFTTFDIINNASSAERLEWDKKLSRSSDPTVIDNLRSQLSVPTLRFVLFLYIQHIHKISLRASLVSGSDEWPTRTRSPDIDGRSNSDRAKTMDENSHLTFVLNNLNEMMDILVEQESYGGGPDSKDLCLSMEAVEALDFLISGSVDSTKNIRPLPEIAGLQHLQQKNGYSKMSRSFSFRNLQTWLRSNLAQNPFGVSCCIAQGRHLSWPLAGEDKESWADRKRGRIATNALFVPKEYIKGNKLIVMSQVCRQTIARSSSTLEGSTVKIHRCHNSYIYLLSPLRSVSIEKCQHSTIVLGAVEATVDLIRCEHTTVVAVCRRVSTIGSKSCTLHVMTPNRPLVFASNEALTIGPYHTYYPKLDEHMAKAGLTSAANLWDQPLYMGSDHQEEDVWEIQRPTAFYTFSIPFEMDGETQEIPGGLPAKYQRALSQRQQQLASWQTTLRETSLDREQKKAFRRVVETRFQEWLQQTGQSAQLEGLAPATAETKLGH